jgi:hypothetical protein
MATLPKLKVHKWTGEEEIQDIESWGKFPFGVYDIIVVEGQEVYSYEDLVSLAKQEPYSSYQVLDLQIMPIIAGG